MLWTLEVPGFRRSHSDSSGEACVSGIGVYRIRPRTGFLFTHLLLSAQLRLVTKVSGFGALRAQP